MDNICLPCCAYFKMSMFQEILSKRMEVSASFFWKDLKCEEAGVFDKNIRPLAVSMKRFAWRIRNPRIHRLTYLTTTSVFENKIKTVWNSNFKGDWSSTSKEYEIIFYGSFGMKNVISHFFIFAFGGYGWGWMYMTKNIALNKSNFVQTQVVMIKELTLICFKFFL